MVLQVSSLKLVPDSIVSSITGLRFIRSVSFNRRSGVLSRTSGFGMLLKQVSPLARCSVGTLFSQLELLSDSLTLFDTFRFREPITVFEARSCSLSFSTRSLLPFLTLALLLSVLPLHLTLLLSLPLLLPLLPVPLLRTITSSCRFLLLNNLSLVSSQLVTFDRITSSSFAFPGRSASSSTSRRGTPRPSEARPIRSSSAACRCSATNSSTCMIRVWSFCFRRLPRLELSLLPPLPLLPDVRSVTVSALSVVVAVVVVVFVGVDCGFCVSSGSVSVVVVAVTFARLFFRASSNRLAVDTSCIPRSLCFRLVTRGLVFSAGERRVAPTERRFTDGG